MTSSRIVAPGELMFTASKPGKNVFVERGKTYASVVGIFDGTKVVSLKGIYEPMVGDVVIGIVSDVRYSVYDVDLNFPYECTLSTKETRLELSVGSVISAKVKDVDELKKVQLTDVRELKGGQILHVSPAKVPRIIGKKMSMLQLLIDKTKCEIVVGKNGRIWMRGKNIPLVVRAIKKIEREAHTSGLTERIQALLEKGV